jgi:hypothetical protein
MSFFHQGVLMYPSNTELHAAEVGLGPAREPDCLLTDWETGCYLSTGYPSAGESAPLG